jgi:hypothetical protein
MKNTLIFTLTLFISLIASKLARGTEVFVIDSFAPVAPDTLFVDTIAEINDGLDTLFITDELDGFEYMRTNSSTEDVQKEVINESLTDPPPFDGNIGVSPNAVLPKIINQGLFGINVSGMFEPSALPEGEFYTEEQWDWLSDLKPQSIRFPSGEYGEFAMLLKQRDGSNSVGYGYDINEIYKYYDRTDGGAPEPMTEAELLLTTALILNTKMDPRNVGKFLDFRNKFLEQQDETERYIDQFIRLIQKIETDNFVAGETYRIKVILCLNITTETAAACKEIVDYLRTNEIYPVHVEGVEMGNEWGDEFHCESMGIHDFNEYYNFLMGTNNSAMTDLYTEFGIPAVLYNGHNFLPVFKDDPAFSVKVGLVAAPHPNGSGLVFESEPLLPGGGGPCLSVTNTEWNAQLRLKYSDKFTPSNRKTFDAVIVHPYYDETNFDYIPFDEMAADFYACGTLWDFDDFDTRLEGAYDGILTEGIKKNFKNFMMKRYLEAYAAFRTELGLGVGTAHTAKEYWTTEYNIKDDNNDPDASEYEKFLPSLYTNSYMHATLIQEWWLKNMKLNFQSGFRTNFFTISTFQNYAGGALKGMLSPANGTEIQNLGSLYFDGLGLDITDFIGFGAENFYVKRTPYFAFELLSPISKNSLQYLPTNFVMDKDNINQPPTVLVNPDKTYLYIFYTNVKSENQTYTLNLENLTVLWPDAPDAVLASPATFFSLEANQPYSTAGKSSMFEINQCYLTTAHDVELVELNPESLNVPDGCPTSVIAENRCLTAPKTTMGYFKVPITPAYYPRLSSGEQVDDIQITPNPTTGYMDITSNTLIVTHIEVFTPTGVSVYQKSGFNINAIDISGFSTGVYFVRLNNEQIIKIIKI